MPFPILTAAVVLLIPSLILFWLVTRTYREKLKLKNHKKRIALFKLLRIGHVDSKRIVGYFHPYCNAGGGGERVLWTAIAATQRADPNIIHVVYSGDTDASKEQILGKVKSRFNIELDPSTLHFVFLDSRKWVEDKTWPHFTLIGQSLGSMYLVWEAMEKLIPDLYIDTMGYAFTFNVVSFLARVPIGAYVHYPTISTDMLERVKSRKTWHTNQSAISSSPVLSAAKLFYYRLFMYYYSQSLRLADFLMVNSTWTKNHIDSILEHSDPLFESVHKVFSLIPFLPFPFVPPRKPKATASQSQTVYPPCDTNELVNFGLEGRERVIVSVAQFRPEKDHAAQLQAFRTLVRSHPEYQRAGKNFVRLVLIGGCRNADDAARLDELKRLSQRLGVDSQVEFIVNAPYAVVLEWLSRASAGMNTMVDEHFGINVVEFMAAGVIPVAHASGGPLMDIVVPFEEQPTGYHAKDPKTFAEALQSVLTLSPEDDLAMRQRARSLAMQKFSEREFEEGWNKSGWKKWLG